MVAANLSKQQELDANSKAIQKINFTGNLERAGITTMRFAIEEAKQTISDFFIRNCKIFVNLFSFNII